MTHRHALSLLEDLVDDELPADKLAELRRLIEDDPGLQRELARSRRLRELLGNIKTPDPGRQYWDETTSLILARTVEAERAQSEAYTERFSLVRALFSVAASIAILITALYVGSNGRTPMPLAGADNNPAAFVAASEQATLSTVRFPVYDHDDALRLAQAMIVMGPPGVFGKCLLFPERVDKTSIGSSI